MDNKLPIVLGVCCACQGTHLVVRNNELPESELDSFDGPFGCGEAGFYLMARHRMFGNWGEWCEGEGTTPAAVIKSEDTNSDEDWSPDEPDDDTVGYAGEGEWPDPSDEEFDGIAVYEYSLYSAALAEAIGEEMTEAPVEPDPEDWKFLAGKALAKPNRCQRAAVY